MLHYRFLHFQMTRFSSVKRLYFYFLTNTDLWLCLSLSLLRSFLCLLLALTRFSSHSLPSCATCHCWDFCCAYLCQVLDIIYDFVLCPDCESPDKTPISAINSFCALPLYLRLPLCVQEWQQRDKGFQKNVSLFTIKMFHVRTFRSFGPEWWYFLSTMLLSDLDILWKKVIWAN